MLATPATSKTICIASAYCRTKARQRGSAFASANLFAPYCSSRAAASAALRPFSGSTSNEAATCSPGSSEYVLSGSASTGGTAIPWAILSPLLSRLPGRGGCSDRIRGDTVRCFGFELLLRDEQGFSRFVVHGRVLRIDACESVDDHAGHRDPQEPLVVRGDDVPGRVLRARPAQHLRERLLVLLPVAALLDVVRVELPVLLGVVDPPQEAPPLLLFGEVEEDLHHRKAVFDERSLPVVDLPVPALPDRSGARERGQLLALEQLGMHADHEHVFVVRAVEDRDLPPCGQLQAVPPEKVVVELLRGGRPKTMHDDALRVDAAHDVPDGAVLAAGIECLKRNQQAVCVLRRESRLIVLEHFDALMEKGLAVPFREEVAGVARVEV